MISKNHTLVAIQIVFEMFGCPNNSKNFHFSGPIVLLLWLKSSTNIGYRANYSILKFLSQHSTTIMGDKSCFSL